MQLGLTEDQEMLRDTFARFFDSESSMQRVRATNDQGGFDPALWQGLADLGTFSMRLPEDAEGLGLGTFDATLVMEEAGRMLAHGPLAETLVAAPLLAKLGGSGLLPDVIAGEKILTLAFFDINAQPKPWLAGGAHADAVIARKGDDILLIALNEDDRQPEAVMAFDGIGQVDLAAASQSVLASGDAAVAAFQAAVEECKLLIAAQVNAMAREAIRLAAAYSCERKAFDVPIGSFQAMSHPLANLHTDIDAGRLHIWKAIHAIATNDPDAATHISLALWWNSKAAAAAGIQALRTFGGYGLTTEYDIHLYNLRGKSLPLVYGDIARWLDEAGRRRYAGETVHLPDVGPVSIDFDLGEDARALAQEVDDFFEATLTPELKDHAHYSWDGHHPEVHRKLAESNLLFPTFPKEKGGKGAGPYARHAASAVWEKHGWTSFPTGTTQMVAAMIDRFGSDELKEDVLKPIMAGEAVCSLGYSEPGSGSDVFAAQTRATPAGNGWRIDGTKMFTSGANLSDYVIMLTRTTPGGKKHEGLTMFIVPMKAQGVEVQPVYTFMDERTNITFYDDVRIPDSYRLGEVDMGIKTMSAGLELEHGGGGFFDSIHSLLEAAEELCRDIDTPTGGKLIEEQQAQARLAQCFAHFHMSEMLSLRALWAAEEGVKIPAAGPMSKMFSTDRFLDSGADLLALTAPLSLAKRKGAPTMVNQSYRHAHGTTIYAGTSEIHRSMIAERALGMPRSR